MLAFIVTKEPCYNKREHVFVYIMLVYYINTPRNRVITVYYLPVITTLRLKFRGVIYLGQRAL